jgi:hypothetical protein
MPDCCRALSQDRTASVKDLMRDARSWFRSTVNDFTLELLARWVAELLSD